MLQKIQQIFLLLEAVWEAIKNLSTSTNTVLDTKMDKENPTGTGYFSLNRKAGSSVGGYSFAEGYNTTASGSSAHAEGATIASGMFQHTEGVCNIEDTEDKYIHIAGNGLDLEPSNAHTLDWNGNAWYQGGIKTGGTGYDDADNIVVGYKNHRVSVTQPIGTVWKKMDINLDGNEVLFEDVVETNDVSWYVNAESAIGVFNDEDDLIAIYVENKGDIWIPATGFNETNVPKDVIDEVYDDKNFNERTSMITYFVEDDTYIITNKIVCGFIDEASTKSIWVNDIKYTFDVAHDYNVDDYIVMYMDGDEIIDCMIIENPYGYNLTDKEYHSWDCDKYEDRSKNDTWVETLDDVWHADGKITFKSCSHCEANEKISLVSVPTTSEN